MKKKECVAMILAGGRGERLGALTHYYSEPSIYFGGNERIIDYTLRNCRDSGIHDIGILSQCFTTNLNEYIKVVHHSSPTQGMHLLPSKENSLYRGTADAVFQNIEFIDQFMPECVLILSGDHIYKMDYRKLIAYHTQTGADVTVATSPVPMNEASRFGILNTRKNGRVSGFEEKPAQPKSNLASMGVYAFKWSILKKYLMADSEREQTHNDFGKDILPEILAADESVYAYRFNGYWRDVGTVHSLWEANMDQISIASSLHNLNTYCELDGSYLPEKPNMIANDAFVNQSIISGGCSIFGKIMHSVLSHSVTVGQGSEITNSVIMPNVYIGENVKISNAIIGTRAVIMDDTEIGADTGSDYFIDSKVCTKGISLVAPWLHVPKGMRFKKNSQINKTLLDQYIDMIEISDDGILGRRMALM